MRMGVDELPTFKGAQHNSHYDGRNRWRQNKECQDNGKYALIQKVKSVYPDLEDTWFKVLRSILYCHCKVQYLLPSY